MSLPCHVRALPAVVLSSLLWTAPAGCAFPSLDPTGLELAWQIRESNAADGEDARRLRTCNGSLAETVDVAVTDLDRPGRQGTFRFTCREGLHTVEELQTNPSEAFLLLRPGEYEVETTLLGPAGVTWAATRDDVKVPSRGQTLLAPTFSLPTTDLVLSFSGRDACSDVRVALRYRTDEDLVGEGGGGSSGGSADTGTTGGGSGTGGTAGSDLERLPTSLYREGLATDAGLSLSWVVSPCAGLAPTHLVEDVDMGRYVLDVAVDGDPSCPIHLTVDRGSLSFSIDLANLPCAG